MKILKKRVLIVGIIFILILSILVINIVLNKINNNEIDESFQENHMIDIINKNYQDVSTELKKYNLDIELKYEYSDTIEKDKVIDQSIKKDTIINEFDKLIITISLGKIDLDKLKNDKINELGRVPIMMYHGIKNMKDSDTKYTKGNVDKDGYTRTSESFRRDLDFYYKNNYRMIRLSDYINGVIDVEYGKSPIVLTFDDGNDNNIKVTGLDSDGNIIIDPNSAVGILEEYKKKYPDYNVTAIFFVTSALFNQPEYNDKILNWLIENNYEVGNHTKGHDNFSKIDTVKTQEVVGYVYDKLDKIIPDKYSKIVALPFGSPYNKTHENYPYILNGTYNNISYETVAALRVGWEADESPFNKKFDKTFIKRCRAYDNDGVEFDIEMNFRLLEKTRYISDGNKGTITISKNDSSNLINNTDIRVIEY